MGDCSLRMREPPKDMLCVLLLRPDEPGRPDRARRLMLAGMLVVVVVWEAELTGAQRRPSRSLSFPRPELTGAAGWELREFSQLWSFSSP